MDELSVIHNSFVHDHNSDITNESHITNRYSQIPRSFMRVSLVLTVIADDKPGIVERLSDQILEAGANWEESRMARLGGQFAGLLRVSIDSDRADALAARLQTLDPSLTLVIERSADVQTGDFRTLHLELVG